MKGTFAPGANHASSTLRCPCTAVEGSTSFRLRSPAPECRHPLRTIHRDVKRSRRQDRSVDSPARGSQRHCGKASGAVPGRASGGAPGGVCGVGECGWDRVAGRTLPGSAGDPAHRRHEEPQLREGHRRPPPHRSRLRSAQRRDRAQLVPHRPLQRPRSRSRALRGPPQGLGRLRPRWIASGLSGRIGQRRSPSATSARRSHSAEFSLVGVHTLAPHREATHSSNV